MISAPAIDPTVTAVTPCTDVQATAAPATDGVASSPGTTGTFAAALQDQQNPAQTPVNSTTAAASNPGALADQRAAFLLPSTSAQPGSEAAAAALATGPPVSAAAPDDLKKGEQLPADGNVLPPGQDLQSLMLSLNSIPIAPLPAVPAATPAAETPVSSAGTPAGTASDVVPTGQNADRAPGTADALRSAIAGLNRVATNPVANDPKPPVASDGRADEFTALLGAARSDAPAARIDESAVSTWQLPADNGTSGTAPAPLAQSVVRDFTLLLQASPTIAGPAPVVASTHPTDTVPSVVLPTATDLSALKPLGDPSQWSQALGDRLLVLADQGLQSATIRLQPEHLGPMEIRIRVEDGNAQVWFSAHHGDTRAALQDAIPKLREMFNDQGMNLLQANVDSGRGGFAERGLPLPPGFVRSEPDATPPPSARAPAPTTRMSAWSLVAGTGHRVDLFV